MSYTKGELVNAALEEIGIAEYEFDISPEQRASAIRRLDSMMAEWTTRGINFPYPLSSIEDTDTDEESGISDWANEAVIPNLAIKIAPSYGKAVSNETKVAARHGLNSLYSIFSKPREMQFPSMPKGAGYKTTDWRWSASPKQEVLKPIDNSFDPSGGPIDE